MRAAISIVRQHGVQFSAGFLATALTAAIYAWCQPPAIGSGNKPGPEQIARMSFAGQMRSHRPNILHTTTIARSRIQPDQDRAPDHVQPAAVILPAAFEIAQRFAGLPPEVSAPHAEREAVRETASLDTKSAVNGSARHDVTSNPTDPITELSEPAVSRQTSGEKVIQDTPLLPAIHQPKPGMRIELARVKNKKTRVAFPFDLNSLWLDKPESGLLIGGLPEGVTLSLGRRTGLGLWQLRGPDVPSTLILVEPSAPAQFELTVLLVDPEGMVVTGIDIEVVMREGAPDMIAAEATKSASGTTLSASSRHGKGAANHRYKQSHTRQSAHGKKRHHPRQTLTTLLKTDAQPARWNTQRARTTAQN